MAKRVYVGIDIGSSRTKVAVVDAERQLLPHRRFPMPAIRRMAGGRPLFEATFNFTHFHVYDEIIRSTGLELLGHQVIEETDLPWLAEERSSTGQDS